MYAIRSYYVEPPQGTLTFLNGGPSAVTFPLETLDDGKYEGTERLILRLANPVDVAPGPLMQAAASILDDDPYDPLLLDDFERSVITSYSIHYTKLYESS